MFTRIAKNITLSQSISLKITKNSRYCTGGDLFSKVVNSLNEGTAA